MVKSRIHLTKPEAVQRILSQHSLPPHLTQNRAKRIEYPTQKQWKLLKKLREAGINPPKADRGVCKEQRRKACQSSMGREVRKLYVMEALEEIDRAKRAELAFLRDERRRRVGGNPPYSARAPRRHKGAVARDVIVWLAWKKLGKFNLRAIKEDIRCVKKVTTYTIGF